MKKLVLLFSIALSTVAFAQEAEKKIGAPAGKALIGDTYGAQVSGQAEKSAISTKKLDKKLKKS